MSTPLPGLTNLEHQKSHLHILDKSHAFPCTPSDTLRTSASVHQARMLTQLRRARPSTKQLRRPSGSNLLGSELPSAAPDLTLSDCIAYSAFPFSSFVPLESHHLVRSRPAL